MSIGPSGTRLCAWAFGAWLGSKPFPLRGLECIAVKGLDVSANESTVVPEVGA